MLKLNLLLLTIFTVLFTTSINVNLNALEYGASDDVNIESKKLDYADSYLEEMPQSCKESQIANGNNLNGFNHVLQAYPLDDGAVICLSDCYLGICCYIGSPPPGPVEESD
jgi:hypothetical protein